MAGARSGQTRCANKTHLRAADNVHHHIRAVDIARATISLGAGLIDWRCDDGQIIGRAIELIAREGESAVGRERLVRVAVSDIDAVT